MTENPGGPLRRRRGRLLAVTAAAALVAGAGSAWAATASGTPVLTTSEVVAKTGPAIVDVVSTLGYQGATAAGTGIVLTSSGEVLTNNHVIDGATAIKVRDVGNGRVYTARVEGYDAAHDIAVLQLQGASGLATAVLGDSATVRTGQKVVAMGNAGGKNGTPSVATGRVTGLHQSITASDESAGTAERLQGLIRTNAGDRHQHGRVSHIRQPGQLGHRNPGLRDPDQRGDRHRQPDRRGQVVGHGARRRHRLPGRGGHLRGVPGRRRCGSGRRRD